MAVNRHPAKTLTPGQIQAPGRKGIASFARVPFATEVNSVATMARFTAVARRLSSNTAIGPSMEKPED